MNINTRIDFEELKHSATDADWTTIEIESNELIHLLVDELKTIDDSDAACSISIEDNTLRIFSPDASNMPNRIEEVLSDLYYFLKNEVVNNQITSMNNVVSNKKQLTKSIMRVEWNCCEYLTDNMEKLCEEPFYEATRIYVADMLDKNADEVLDEELDEQINESYNAYYLMQYRYDRDSHTDQLDVEVELI